MCNASIPMARSSGRPSRASWEAWDPWTTAAKVVASAYALFSGLLFIGILGILLLPFAHRLMHRLHIEDSKRSDV
jgi:hypothetical protein